MSAPVSSGIRGELEFVERLGATLREQGFRVRTEISNMGQSVDVVATRGRWVTVIEAKLDNWRKAISQCRAHEHVADYICVAIGSASVPPDLAVMAEQLGYGVIHYNRSSGIFEWALRPKLNRSVWGPQRRYWASKIRKIRNAN